MKKIGLICLLALLLLSAACGQARPAATVSEVTEATSAVPQELPGVWVSADAGTLDLTETITFYENGNLEVSATYQGKAAGTIYGTYRVEFDTIFCDITEGADPFDITYTFRIDGRELILTDAEGDAHYLRTS